MHRVYKLDYRRNVIRSHRRDKSEGDRKGRRETATEREKGNGIDQGRRGAICPAESATTAKEKFPRGLHARYSSRRDSRWSRLFDERSLHDAVTRGVRAATIRSPLAGNQPSASIPFLRFLRLVHASRGARHDSLYRSTSTFRYKLNARNGHAVAGEHDELNPLKRAPPRGQYFPRYLGRQRLRDKKAGSYS